MDEVPPKKSTLSVDRAAFLLLRVKKAFKKKRHLRKEKPIQAADALQAQSRSCRKMPPPLLRSRTLPAIVLPGIPVMSLHTENNYKYLDDPLGTKSTMNRCATLSKNAISSKSRKLLMPPNDDSSLVQRRKSAGQSCYCSKLTVGTMVGNFQPENIDVSEVMHTCDGLESHSDGSVLLRIPAPHVVAARAYRLPPTKLQTETSSKKLNHTVATDVTSNTGSPGSTTSTTLTRLVQLLHQTSTSKTSQNDYIFSVPIGSTDDEHAPRRLSWERRKYSTAMQRSASIDSVTCEAFWSNIPRPSLDIPRPLVTPFNKRPSTSSLFSNCSTSSQNAQLNINYNEVGSSSSAGSSRRESLLSPSSTRRNKLTRVINEKVPNMMNRCYSNDHTPHTPPPHKVHLRNCLRSPGVLLRQKSFHSIADLSRFRHVNNAGTTARYSVNDNVISNNHTFATLRSDTNSVDKKNDDTYAHISLSPHRHVPSSPEYRVHQKNAQTHKTRDFCSQQLTNILPLAKQRSQIPLKSEEDLKEMEYLIPQAAVSALAPTSTNSALHKQLPQSGLSISRQSIITRSSDMSHPKNVKLNTETKDTCTDESTNPIIVSRQPVNASGRVKGGNTPHRNKMSKKQLKLAQAQLDKFTQINVHLHGLFSAVEHGHLDKARTIIESTDVDVNCINSDGLSTLDVAVLSNNRSMTKMLLQHGAVEGSKYSTDSIGTKLNALLKDAESRIHDLSGSSNGQSTGQSTFATRPSISSIIIGNTSSSVTGCTGNETDKQIEIWERRVKGLRRVLLGWDQARPPDTPSAITVDVTGENSIVVQLLEPMDGAIATKFKVQWSTRSDFGNVVGERIILEWISFHRTMGSKCYINGLTQGRRYFIRAMCGNVKGWGPFKTSVPASVVPSSWRDVNNHEDRFIGRQHLLDNLFSAVRLARPADVSELVLDSSSVQRRNPKKKTTIKQLFSVASRFQKNLRRGIYLASIVYCDDKILVTSEDFLPVIEIDESYPSTLHTDYHWLMKVACSWEDVKSLRSDMERNITSAVHFRTKLLSAVYHMQSALGLIDLGSLYYKPFRDSHGTVVLTCVQAVRSQKTISILNSRWLPISKLQKKIVAIHEDSNISEKLILSIGEQIHYHQASMQHLESGLYLGYLKMQCSVEQIQVVVPVKTPNVLPHTKVRDNSHINAEEWQVLKRHRNSATGCGGASQHMLLDFNANTADVMTEGQRLFLHDLATATHKLLVYMNIRLEDASTHRLYDVEVIEHSKDISFLVICPSVELTCAAPGQPEILLQNDELASLSVQAFEMIHLRTYQSGIIQKYSRLSCILELDTALANHSHREAFSTSELEAAKDRLAKLQELTTNLNTVWKSVRWLMDVIAFARDKNVQPSVAMHEILDFAQTSGEMHTDSCEQPNLLQLPMRDVKINKSGSGRGSWPGPAGSVHCSSIAVEHSKSEQNLGRSEKVHNVVDVSDQSPSVIDSAQMLHVMQEYKQFDEPVRKSSAESITSEYTAHSSYSATDSEALHAIPPSQSADMITLETTGDRRSQYSGVHRNRTNSNTSASNIQPPPDISISHSVPHLFSKPKTMVSSLSLKTPLTTDFDHTSGALNIQEGTENPSKTQMKAASSSNLRDGGLYLRSTLSALQTEMKTSTDEAQVLKNSSSRSLSHQSSEEDSASGSSVNSEQSSGIIQVYTAYNTGLASGTSLKLHVTPKTSAREVINLVVKQLNMAAVLKGNSGPIYTSEMLDNFCLVAVIGARERCLRDDFKPLQLQNPWKKGRLYVRQKHELLAAIEHSSRKSQLI